MSLVNAESLPFARKQATLPLMIIAFGGGLTGFSGIFVRFSETGALATGGWRLLFASLALLPFLRLARSDEEKMRPFSPILILAGLFFAIDMAFFNWSLSYTSIAQSTLIVNLAPIVALAAGFLLFGERFGTAKALALIAAVGGAALMTLSRAEESGTLFGNGLAAIGMLGYALYLVAVKHARDSHGTLSIMLGSSIAAGAMMFAAALLAGEQMLPVSLGGWAALIALGLVSHVFGQGLIAFGMRDAPVGLASILLLSQPLVAAFAAWAIFDEGMGPLEIAGAALILAGLVMASRARS
jgi:drug/metabolite transporter (DMT)-like permease